jgi:inosose dehydratase
MENHATGIQIGNAPVSWAVYEAGGPHPGFEPVLDGIARAGYAGTELGPYGFLPTEPGPLDRALKAHHLSLASSYLALPLEDAAARSASVAQALQVARLLASQGVGELIVGDDEDPERVALAGRMGAGGPRWNDRQWAAARETLLALARALREECGMRVVVHHHAGTFVESPEEIERLLAETPAGVVDLCLDTGHCVYGGGDPVELVRRHGDRVRYVHLKDVRAEELERVRRQEFAFRRGAGVFCAPGQGDVPLALFVEALRARTYRGWMIVEQDIVPDADGRLEPNPDESARKTRDYLRRELDL